MAAAETKSKTQVKFNELLDVVFNEIDISHSDRTKLMRAIRSLIDEHHDARVEAYSRGLDEGKRIWKS